MRLHTSIRGAAGIAALALVAIGISGMSSCTGTKEAYKAAEGLEEQAFVVTEHYAALVKEAADIAVNPATPPEVKAALQAADREAKPFIIGNPETGQPGLRELAQAYENAKNAETQAALQAALLSATRSLAGFVRAVKAAAAAHSSSVIPAPPGGELEPAAAGAGT